MKIVVFLFEIRPDPIASTQTNNSFFLFFVYLIYFRLNTFHLYKYIFLKNLVICLVVVFIFHFILKRKHNPNKRIIKNNNRVTSIFTVQQSSEWMMEKSRLIDKIICLIYKLNRISRASGIYIMGFCLTYLMKMELRARVFVTFARFDVSCK